MSERAFSNVARLSNSPDSWVDQLLAIYEERISAAADITGSVDRGNSPGAGTVERKHGVRDAFEEGQSWQANSTFARLVVLNLQAFS